MCRDGVDEFAVLVVLAKARPQQVRGNERQRAALEMDDPRAGIVARSMSKAPAVAHLRQPAAAPHPAAEDRISDRADEQAEDKEALEAPTLGAGAGHDRGRGVHEHHHEQEPDHCRRVISLAGEEEPGVAADAPAVVGGPVVGYRRADTPH